FGKLEHVRTLSTRSCSRNQNFWRQRCVCIEQIQIFSEMYTATRWDWWPLLARVPDVAPKTCVLNGKFGGDLLSNINFIDSLMSPAAASTPSQAHMRYRPTNIGTTGTTDSLNASLLSRYRVVESLCQMIMAIPPTTNTIRETPAAVRPLIDPTHPKMAAVYLSEQAGSGDLQNASVPLFTIFGLIAAFRALIRKGNGGHDTFASGSGAKPNTVGNDILFSGFYNHLRSLKI
ncbi:hypothetical protein BCR34DRAFT_653488, partial [Clohesyomyces aquaticus]